MKIFLPKDRVFFQLFEEVAEHVNEMGIKLKEMVNEPDVDVRANILAQIENLEHKNDDLTHSIFTELGRNFITPFDREDIHYLATSLDDIADYIYASAKKINFYKVNPNDTGIHKLADLVLQGTQEIKKVVLAYSGGLDTSGNPADKLAVSFKDVSGVNNYYKINLYYFNNSISNWVPLTVPRTDPSLAGYNSIVQNDGGILFSDDLFNGKLKTITMNVSLGYVINNLGDKYKITLSSISEDLFLYYKSLQRAQDAKEINFQGGYNNAVVIHSNIDGGLGIIGTQSKEDVILK